MSGESMAWLKAALSLDTIACGVPLGRKMMFQLPALKPGMPCSWAVARSGSSGARLAASNAGAFTSLSRTCG